MRNAGLDELQAEKIGGKDISNIRYADDTTLMAESEENPSSRAEGLLFLHGLESNPGSSLQKEEEAGLH